MQHVFWSYPGEVAGRPGPRVAPWSLSEMKAGGFDVVLSVASDLFEHAEMVAAGLMRGCIPLPDIGPPDDYVVKVCAAELQPPFPGPDAPPPEIKCPIINHIRR